MTTNPLAKAITTLEAQLVLASDVVMAVAAVPGVSALSPKVAAIVIGAQHIALLVQRAVVKSKALGVNAGVDRGDSVLTILSNIEDQIEPQTDFHEVPLGNDAPKEA